MVRQTGSVKCCCSSTRRAGPPDFGTTAAPGNASTYLTVASVVAGGIIELPPTRVLADEAEARREHPLTRIGTACGPIAPCVGIDEGNLL